MIVKLWTIIIGVESIEASREFYEKVFGFISREESPHYLAGYIGDILIEIEEDAAYRLPYWAEWNIGTYKNSEFIVDNMDEFLEQVVEFGGMVLTPPRCMPWWSINTEISDPDNNIFLISQK